eukprot:4370415-Amphidinium_carterae.1
MQSSKRYLTLQERLRVGVDRTCIKNLVVRFDYAVIHSFACNSLSLIGFKGDFSVLVDCGPLACKVGSIGAARFADTSALSVNTVEDQCEGNMAEPASLAEYEMK